MILSPLCSGLAISSSLTGLAAQPMIALSSFSTVTTPRGLLVLVLNSGLTESATSMNGVLCFPGIGMVVAVSITRVHEACTSVFPARLNVTPGTLEVYEASAQLSAEVPGFSSHRQVGCICRELSAKWTMARVRGWTESQSQSQLGLNMAHLGPEPPTTELSHVRALAARVINDNHSQNGKLFIRGGTARSRRCPRLASSIKRERTFSACLGPARLYQRGKDGPP